MKRPSKPWLIYHKPGAPVREYAHKRKQPRQLIWARLILLFGFHRFYLRQPGKGVLFFLVLIVLLPVGMLIASILNLDVLLSDPALSVVAFTPYFIVYLVEYFRLPTLVRNANTKMFGRRAELTPEMQGSIGAYAALRPIVIIIIAFYACLAVSNSISWSNWIQLIFGLGYFVSIITFLFRITQITKRVKQEQNHD